MQDPVALAAHADEDLLITPTGNKLHIRGCPHLTDTSEVRVATKQDVGTRELCSACSAELNGLGRTPFDNLDSAMEAFSMPVEARAMVRELVADIAVDRYWIPYSRSYIGLGNDTTRAVYVGKPYVWSDLEVIALPGYAPASGGGTPTSERKRPVCPTCSFELPGTGICDDC